MGMLPSWQYSHLVPQTLGGMAAQEEQLRAPRAAGRVVSWSKAIVVDCLPRCAVLWVQRIAAVCTPSSYLGIQVTADHASASGMVFSRRQERRKVCRGVGSLREEKVRIAPMERITGVFQPKKREASAPRTMKSAQRNRTVPINKSCRYTTVSSTASAFRRIGIYRLSHLEIGGP